MVTVVDGSKESHNDSFQIRIWEVQEGGGIVILYDNTPVRRLSKAT